MANTHGWLITVDHLKVGPSVVGTSGPRDIPDDVLARLQAGEGATFQLRDDDGELYYEGRFLELWPDGQPVVGLSEDAFAPLDDFGMPDSGCTTIAYQNAEGAWEVL